MVKIRPFRAIRPNSYEVDKVASLPYDVVDTEEARQLGEENEKSFLHIDRAEIDLSEEVPAADDRVYVKAKENLADFRTKGWLIRDHEPAYYLYRLKRKGRSQYGIVMTIHIEEYLSHQIKKHELTRPDKEQDRIRHMDECDANTSPIFLTYRDNEELNELIRDFKDKRLPIYAFESFYEVEHFVWKIDDSTFIKRITKLFGQDIPTLYIADGHHRMESAAKVAQSRRNSYPQAPEDAEFNYFLGVAFPESQLEVLPYHRLVQGEMTPAKWKKLKENFEVQELQEEVFQPEEAGTFGMYTEEKWYQLTIKPDKMPERIVESLDVSLLQDLIFKRLFKIEDPRTDKRLKFVGGIHDASELMEQADSKKKMIAFTLPAASLETLLSIADAGEIMPPKSTWFEPKLLSGLFLHALESTVYSDDATAGGTAKNTETKLMC